MSAVAALSELRVHARAVFDAGLKSADPLDAIRRYVHVDGDRFEVADRRYDLAEFRRIYVIGGGKAAARMGLALEELLGGRIAGGIIVVKYDHGLRLKRVNVVEAGHPVPDEAGLSGARQVIELVDAAGESDLILFLVSGGGSALLPCPANGLTLEDKQRTTQILLNSGATIREMNAIRRHLSKVKGGRLAQLAHPARVISLILSDVVGDTLEDIASGPTAPDPSTYADCVKIIQRYELEEKIPPSVRHILERGVKGEIDETPKPRDAVFEKVQNIVIVSNQLATQAAKSHAETLGYHTMILSGCVEGESRRVALGHVAMMKEILDSNSPSSRPACLISGGETTVTVRGNGVGGRNQEFALAAAIQLDSIEDALLLSAGTDGTDGPTNAAGGIVDGETIGRGRSKGLDAVDFLARNDSYRFLEATGDLLITGPTFTNVMDLQVMLIA